MPKIVYKKRHSEAAKVHLVQFSESDGSSEDDESELLDSVADTSYSVKEADKKQHVECEQDETVIRKL